jgi:hypothetical protein
LPTEQLQPCAERVFESCGLISDQLTRLSGPLEQLKVLNFKNLKLRDSYLHRLTALAHLNGDQLVDVAVQMRQIVNGSDVIWVSGRVDVQKWTLKSEAALVCLKLKF